MTRVQFFIFIKISFKLIIKHKDLIHNNEITIFKIKKKLSLTNQQREIPTLLLHLILTQHLCFVHIGNCKIFHVELNVHEFAQELLQQPLSYLHLANAALELIFMILFSISPLFNYFFLMYKHILRYFFLPSNLVV